MKYKEIVKLIEDHGWVQVRQRSSHPSYKHDVKRGIVTIAYHHFSDEIPKGTLNSILKQAKLK